MSGRGTRARVRAGYDVEPSRCVAAADGHRSARLADQAARSSTERARSLQRLGVHRAASLDEHFEPSVDSGGIRKRYANTSMIAAATPPTQLASTIVERRRDRGEAVGAGRFEQCAICRDKHCLAISRTRKRSEMNSVVRPKCVELRQLAGAASQALGERDSVERRATDGLESTIRATGSWLDPRDGASAAARPTAARASG